MTTSINTESEIEVTRIRVMGMLDETVLVPKVLFQEAKNRGKLRELMESLFESLQMDIIYTPIEESE